MSQSMAVFGAGPGLGQAVAHRYASEGYDVVVVGRHRPPLEQLAESLAAGWGVQAYAVAADLADTAAMSDLASRVRSVVGELDALYYAPTPNDALTPAADLSPAAAAAFDAVDLLFFAAVGAGVPSAHA